MTWLQVSVFTVLSICLCAVLLFHFVWKEIFRTTFNIGTELILNESHGYFYICDTDSYFYLDELDGYFIFVVNVDSISKHGRRGSECCRKFRKLLPCCDTEERAESLADWLIVLSVMLFNVCSGICLTGFSVLYRDMALTFDASMAAVGWIPGIQFCIACILGNSLAHRAL